MASQGISLVRTPREKSSKGLEKAAQNTDTYVFHAGTALENGKIVTSGGRVLCVTGVGKTLEQALERAYRTVSDIQFEGVQYRKDIAWRALKRSS
jgi:phosphoribosylamine---glycine ligase